MYADFATLRGEHEDEDEDEDEDDRIVAWPPDLCDAALDEDISYVSAAKPGPREYPLWFAVTHFFNHQTHHRGQITTLLAQRGVDPAVTDLIWLPEFQPSSGAFIQGS